MAKQKLKLPKRLAGIKVPKPLRRSSKRFAKHLRKTGGLDLLAHALVAAGTALMSNPQARQAVVEAGQKVKDRSSALADMVADRAAAEGLPADQAKKQRKKDKQLRGQPHRIEEPAQRH